MKVPDDNLPRFKTLSFIIDQTVSQTYQDFVQLWNLLQKKPEDRRKEPFLVFTHQTRCKFVKLYALVKWAKSLSKFDYLPRIDHFLEQWGLRYFETAEALKTMVLEDFPFIW